MMINPPSSPRRKRACRPRELRQEAPPPMAILQDEIQMLRSVMRRVIALADEGRSLEELLHVLDTLSSAAARLARLLKAEQDFSKETEDIGEILNQALGEVIETLKKEG
ncbi:MAG: hypothetical protein HPY59_14220 [Anaerolineae bacterium]|nr:hypothetical protein [Anaerolineae bacterium]